ncbi:MAG TPA: hypothetical protein VFH73_00630 [Polyangia bacterium]|jgi:hypothetical protein|nr:hypothetical protein [Polyangia bacterium]
MANAPATLEDLYRDAKVDLALADPTHVLKWSFLVARYAGRLALANQRMRELAEERSYVRCNARVMRDRPDLLAAGQAAALTMAQDYMMQNEPEAAREQAVEVEFQDATGMVEAARLVRDQLAARTVSMAARPPLRTVQGGKA